MLFCGAFVTKLDSSEDIRSNYETRGFAHLRSFISPQVARGFIARLKADLSRQGLTFEKLEKEQPLLSRAAAEMYGYHYAPMATFHWGMTPAVEAFIKRPLFPTYAYFRIYRAGDICRVHGDRPACEHSISLTLDYSDGIVWPLEIATTPINSPYERADEAFRLDEQAIGLPMEPGDAVLYRGVHYHHGRTIPNPNSWSAHLFLHWVERDGPHADSAFDGNFPPDRINL